MRASECNPEKKKVCICAFVSSNFGLQSPIIFLFLLLLVVLVQRQLPLALPSLLTTAFSTSSPFLEERLFHLFVLVLAAALLLFPCRPGQARQCCLGRPWALPLPRPADDRRLGPSSALQGYNGTD